LKALQILDNLIPNSSEGRRVVTIVNELHRKGHRVTVASAFKGDSHAETVKELFEPGVEVLWHRPVFKFSNYYYSPEMYGLLSSDEYDVVHAHSYRHYGTYVGALLRKKRKTPFVLSPYGSVGYGSSRRLMPFYIIQDLITRNYPLRYADKILANTRYEKDSLIDFGADPEKIDVIYREVDTALFKKTDEVVDDTVLYVGRVTPIKGIELLIETMSLLGDSFKLVIVGPVEDEGYHGRLRYRIQALGLNDRVKFTGKTPYRDIPSYFSRALVLVLPSIYENLGGVLLEAQACECPVIATNIGGVKEVFEDGKTGFLLKGRSAEELAEKINVLASNTSLRNEMGYKGRSLVETKFTTKEYIKTILCSYEKAMEKNYD